MNIKSALIWSINVTKQINMIWWHLNKWWTIWKMIATSWICVAITSFALQKESKASKKWGSILWKSACIRGFSANIVRLWKQECIREIPKHNIASKNASVKLITHLINQVIVMKSSMKRSESCVISREWEDREEERGNEWKVNSVIIFIFKAQLFHLDNKTNKRGRICFPQINI